MTFGDEKHLWFRLHKNKETFNDDTKLRFAQPNGSLIILHPDDEKPDEEGWHWRHMSNMISSNSITFSFTFRCVQERIGVKPTGELLNPKISHTKGLKFKAGNKEFQSSRYQNKRVILERRMKDFFETHS